MYFVYLASLECHQWEWDYRLGILVASEVSEFGLRLILQTLYFLKCGSIYDMWQSRIQCCQLS